MLAIFLFDIYGNRFFATFSASKTLKSVQFLFIVGHLYPRKGLSLLVLFFIVYRTTTLKFLNKTNYIIKKF